MDRQLPPPPTPVSYARVHIILTSRILGSYGFLDSYNLWAMNHIQRQLRALSLSGLQALGYTNLSERASEAYPQTL